MNNKAKKATLVLKIECTGDTCIGCKHMAGASCGLFHEEIKEDEIDGYPNRCFDCVNAERMARALAHISFDIHKEAFHRAMNDLTHIYDNLCAIKGGRK